MQAPDLTKTKLGSKTKAIKIQNVCGLNVERPIYHITLPAIQVPFPYWRIHHHDIDFAW